MKRLTMFFVFATVFVFNMGLYAQVNDQHYGIHNHHLAIFTGSTSNLEAEYTDFSIGADYEYRLAYGHNKFGVGLIGEIVFAEHQETIIALPIFYHPTENFKFFYAPGFAIAEGEHGESHKAFWSRLGVGYDFHLGNYSIAPGFAADFIEGNVSLVYGLSFGMGF